MAQLGCTEAQKDHVEGGTQHTRDMASGVHRAQQGSLLTLRTMPCSCMEALKLRWVAQVSRPGQWVVHIVVQGRFRRAAAQTVLPPLGVAQLQEGQPTQVPSTRMR